MKRLVFLLVLLACLFTGASDSVPAPPPIRVGWMSCAARYNAFLNELDSGELQRTEIRLDSLLDAVSYTSEEIRFTRGENNQRTMTYRERQPMVFWHQPQPDYFDGTRYFYANGDDWSLDTRGRYAAHLQPDFFGVSLDLLQADPVVRDEVYYRDDAYYGYLTTEATDGSRRTELTARMQPDGDFEELLLIVTKPGKNDRRDYVQLVRVRYDQINQPLTVAPPAGLDTDALARLSAQKTT